MSEHRKEFIQNIEHDVAFRKYFLRMLNKIKDAWDFNSPFESIAKECEENEVDPAILDSLLVEVSKAYKNNVLHDPLSFQNLADTGQISTQVKNQLIKKGFKTLKDMEKLTQREFMDNKFSVNMMLSVVTIMTENKVSFKNDTPEKMSMFHDILLGLNTR